MGRLFLCRTRILVEAGSRFDAVKHLVLCHVEKRPPKLDLDVYHALMDHADRVEAELAKQIKPLADRDG